MMKKPQKPEEIGPQPTVDVEVNLTIQLIITKIRKTGSKVHIKEVKDINPKVDLAKLLAGIESQTKLKYNKREEVFELTSVYGIKNINDLYTLLVQTREGVLENEELWDSYSNCKTDIEILKRDGLVISLESNERKTNVLFGVNTQDSVQVDYRKIEKDALEALREIWNDEIKSVSEVERKAILEQEGIEVKRKAVLHRERRPAEKEEKKRMKHKKTRDILFSHPNEEEKK